MVLPSLRSSVFIALLLLLVFMNQPVYGGYDGCSVLPGSFPGREVLQVPLDIMLAGACGRHDACYRLCVGVPYSPTHKDTCDLLFFLELEAWCGSVSTTQELANIGLSAEDFLPPCIGAMSLAYAAVQTLAGGAYRNDQRAYCDPCFNGESALDCSLRGGDWNFFRCRCEVGPCGLSPEFVANCELQGGFIDEGLCMCWGSGASPVIVDLGGNGFHLVGFENGVSFDINGDHTRERIGWTRPDSDDAFLVLDRNRNGQIDDGLELFGNATDQPASSHRNGFLALAMFDRPEMGGNGDGKLTAADSIFSGLRLWLDADHDGVSTAGELSPLEAWGLVEIDLDYKEARRRDGDGNEFRYRAQVTFANHRRSFAYDVFFSHQVQ